MSGLVELGEYSEFGDAVCPKEEVSVEVASSPPSRWVQDEEAFPVLSLSLR
jgi:hypothetical protein